MNNESFTLGIFSSNDADAKKEPQMNYFYDEDKVRYNLVSSNGGESKRPHH